MEVSSRQDSVQGHWQLASVFSGLALFLLLAAAPTLALMASERQTYENWIKSKSAATQLAAADGSYEVVSGSLEMTEGAAAQSYTAGKTKKSKKSFTANRREGGTDGSGSAKRSGLLTTGTPNVLQLWPESESAPQSGSNGSKDSGNGFGSYTLQSPLPSSNTVRTLCVRLCDGYYWPVSFATSRDKLSKDAATCESSCGSPARLFYYSNPGGEAEDMRDLRGNSYARLPTAFLYRTHFSASCKCQPDPWEEASLAKHRKYAELAKAKKTKLASAGKKKKKKKKSIDSDDTVAATVVSLTTGDQTEVLSSGEASTADSSASDDFGSGGLIKVIKKKGQKKAGKKSIATVRVTKGKPVKSGLLGSSGTAKFTPGAGSSSSVFRVKRGSTSRAKQ